MTDKPPPSEIIRRAADTMRKRANAATDGPWIITDAYPSVLVVSGDYALTIAEVDDGRPAGSVKDAAYIAAMHPVVARAIADWLDYEAAEVENNVTGHAAPAFAVARAYLGKD